MRRILRFLSFLFIFAFVANALAVVEIGDTSLPQTCETTKVYTSCNSGYVLSSESTCIGYPCTGNQYWNLDGKACQNCPSNSSPNGTYATNCNCDTGHNAGGSSTTTTVNCTLNTITVTYNLNGGSGTTPSATSCQYNTSCNLTSMSATTFYKAGKKLLGWSTDSSATTAAYTTSGTFTSNTTLYAVWGNCDANTYHPNEAGTATNTCTACGTGYHSSAGAATCTGDSIACGAGNYLRASDATCQPCPAGKYCSGGTYTFNGSDQGITGNITAGYYSSGGAKTATPTSGSDCLSGYNCGNCADKPDNSDGRPWYSNAGATSCTLCPEVESAYASRLYSDANTKSYWGYWNNNIHNSVNGCAARFKNDPEDTTGEYELSCYYAMNGGTGYTDSHHCEIYGDWNVDSCAAGKYNNFATTGGNVTGAERMGIGNGWMSTGGVDAFTGYVCTDTDAGYYSPAGDTNQTICPVGSYSTGGAAACTQCSTGYTTSGTGSTSASACVANTYTINFLATTTGLGEDDSISGSCASLTCTYGGTCKTRKWNTANYPYKCNFTHTHEDYYYVLTGWSTGENGAGTIYGLDADISGLVSGLNNGATLNLYAVWTNCADLATKGTNVSSIDVNGRSNNTCSYTHYCNSDAYNNTYDGVSTTETSINCTACSATYYKPGNSTWINDEEYGGACAWRCPSNTTLNGEPEADYEGSRYNSSTNDSCANVQYTFSCTSATAGNAWSPTVNSGDTTVSTPTKPGYSFAGATYAYGDPEEPDWTAAISSSGAITLFGDSGWDYTGSPTNIEFECGWNNPITYTVAYDKNRPSAAVANVTGTTQSTSHTYGTSKALRTNGYSLTGWTFAGWNTEADGSGTDYTNGQEVLNLTTVNGATVTLYAQWTRSTTTVTLKQNYNSTDNTTITTVTAIYGLAMPTTGLSVPTRAGYTFTGYYYQRSGGTQYYNVSGASLSSARTWDHDVQTATLYAQWTPTQYNITYDTNGGNFETNATHPSTYNIESNSFTISAPTRNGYTFDGWNVTTALTSWGSGSSSSGATNFTVATGTYGDIALQAQWTPGTGTEYRVCHYLKDVEANTYTLNGGDCVTKTGTTNASITLTNETNAFTGFTYVKGVAGTSAAGTSLPNGNDTTTTILADGTRVISLYYNRNTYNVTLATGTGISTVSGAGTYEYGKTLTINATPSAGYNWYRWTQTTGGAQVSTTQSYQFTVTGNVSYTANATPKTITITYNKNANDATGTCPQTQCTYGSGCDLQNPGGDETTCTFSRNRMVIREWNTQSDGSGNSYDIGEEHFTVPANDITLYAIWDECPSDAGIKSYNYDTYVDYNTCWYVNRCDYGYYNEYNNEEIDETHIDCAACSNAPLNANYVGYPTSSACEWMCPDYYSIDGDPNNYSEESSSDMHDKSCLPIKRQIECTDGTFTETVAYGDTSVTPQTRTGYTFNGATLDCENSKLSSLDSCNTYSAGMRINSNGNFVNANNESTSWKFEELLNANDMPPFGYSGSVPMTCSWTANQYTCSAGQYLPANSTSCQPCPAGKYCSGDTYTFNASVDQGITGECATGSYSAAGASACTPCQNGTTTNGAGQSSCNATCSNNANVATWETATWNSNTVTNACTIASCVACMSGAGVASCAGTVTNNACVYSGTCSPGYQENGVNATCSGSSCTCLAQHYKVIYDCGEDGERTNANPELSSLTATFGAPFTPAASIICTKAGHDFVGWKVSDTNDIKNAAFIWNYIGNKTLTAQWSTNTYNVTYSCGDGSASGTLPNGITAEYGASFTPANGNICTNTGHNFTGWNVSDTNDIKNAAFTWEYIEDKTLTAQWSCNDGYIENSTTGLCEQVKFWLDTTNNTNSFGVYLSAKGTFVIDWGDGHVQTINRTNTTAETYTHSYDVASSYTIRFAGGASAYNTATNVPAISFFAPSSAAKIKQLYGSLGALFEQKGTTAGTYPSFYKTFRGATSLTSLPNTLFSGITSAAPSMFVQTFYGCTNLQTIDVSLFGNITGSAANLFDNTFNGCSKLSAIPSGLFANVSGGADYMFQSTFKGCTKITSIPVGLFSGITTGASDMFSHTFYGTGITAIPDDLFSNVASVSTNMFKNTFYNCSALTGYIPPTTFAGLIANDSTKNTNMWDGTFAGTQVATSCASYPGKTQYVTGYEGTTNGTTWNTRVSCRSACQNGQFVYGVDECPVERFSVTTTSNTSQFAFSLSASGIFWVDWGDGKVEKLIRQNTNLTEYNHTYSSAGSYTIKFGSAIAGYNTNPGTPAITFYKENGGSQAKIQSISGSLGAMFTQSSDEPGDYPSFYQTFRGATGLTEIPARLFSGLTGGDFMFKETFMNCENLTSVPALLFMSITEGATSMFEGTFLLSGLESLPSTPMGLFSNITTPAEDMFLETFSGTYLTTVPANTFGGLTSGAPGMFEATFYDCQDLTSVPAGLFSNITSTADDELMFSQTFHGCTSLTNVSGDLFVGITAGAYGLFDRTFSQTGLTSIPAGLFRNVTSAAELLFGGTFDSSSRLGGYIPKDTFAGLIAHQSPNATNMWLNTFRNTQVATSCTPYTGKAQYITGYEGNTNGTTWNGKVSCDTAVSTITLNSNHNSSDNTTIATVTATYGLTMPLTDTNNQSLTVPTRTGYTFTGYYDARSGENQYYGVSGNSLSSVQTWNKTGADVTLYAHWTANSYTCDAGKYLPSNSVTCQPCPAGKYCSSVQVTYTFDANNDQGIIGECATGSYSAAGASACTPCQNGTTTSGTGQSSCNATCSNNTNASTWTQATWNSNNTVTNACTIATCSACVVGTGVDECSGTPINNACVYSGTCLPGYQENGVNATCSGSSCTCAVSYYTVIYDAGEGGSGVIASEIVEYSSSFTPQVPTSNTIHKANAVFDGWKISDTELVITNEMIETGGIEWDYTEGKRLTAVWKCQEGYTLNTTEQSRDCVPCAAGTYKSLIGNDACTPASKGSYVSGTGATSQTACEIGTYTDQVGQISCTSCPTGFTTLATGAQSFQHCRAGETVQISDSTGIFKFSTACCGDKTCSSLCAVTGYTCWGTNSGCPENDGNTYTCSDGCCRIVSQ